jgi:hypothetical protein
MNDWIASPRSAREIAAIAVTARDILGFNNAYVPNLAGILEIELPKLVPDYTFIVEDTVFDSLGNPVFAQTRFMPPSISFTESKYLGLVDNDPHARFTAAHELGHMLLHRTDKKLNRAPGIQSKYNNKSYSSEWQANEFAASFLAPEHIARCFDDPSELAANTLVSLRVAQIRLTNLGLWPRERKLPKNF